MGLYKNIKADLGLEPSGRVQRFFTDTCRRYMDKYVPKRDGNLRKVIRQGANYIEYEMPYAEIQYLGIIWGHPIQNYTTPGTGPYWDKKMWSAEGTQVVKEVQEYVNRGL